MVLKNISQLGGDKPYKIEGDKLIYKDLTFLIWKQAKNISVESILPYDAVIIEPNSIPMTRDFIRNLRSNHNKDFYLKPIFLFNWYNPDTEPLINLLIDGVIHSLDEIDEVSDKVHRFFMRYIELVNKNPENYEEILINKALAFLYTRDRNIIKPFRSLNSGIGYTFPILSVNYNKKNEVNVLDVLEYAEKEGYLTGEFYDKIYLCNQCSGGFLSYRESCPKCNSTNLESQELIHHFPCAYVGPERDFVVDARSDDMQCPKCDKKLKHIGVDYDKPSMYHRCLNCNHQFQEMQITAKCIQCGNDEPVENLVDRRIKSYKVTKKGEFAAVKGFMVNHHDFKTIEGTVENDVFKTMVQHEQERVKVTNGDSCIAILYLHNSHELYHLIGGEKEKRLLTDLVKVIRGQVRPLDIISFENSSTVRVLLSESSWDDTKLIVRKLQLLINRLLKDTFVQVEVSIKTNVREINPNYTIEQQLHYLNQDLDMK